MSLAGSSTSDPVDKHDLGCYLVYTNKDRQVSAKNLDTGNIDYKSPVGRAATSAETTSVINGALTALQSTGGLVKLKRGGYLTNNILHIGKSDGSLVGTNIRLTGEGRGISLLKFDPAATPTNMVHGNCNLTLEYLTLDASTHANEMFHCNKGADLITVQYCSFIMEVRIFHIGQVIH